MYYKNLPELHTGVLFEREDYRAFSVKVYEYGGMDGLYFRLQIEEQFEIFFISGTAVATFNISIAELQSRIAKFRRRILDNPMRQILDDDVTGLSTFDIDLLKDVTHTREETDSTLGRLLLAMDYTHKLGGITIDVFCDTTELSLNEIAERLNYFKSRGWIEDHGTDLAGCIELTESGRIGIQALLSEIESKPEQAGDGIKKMSKIDESESGFDIFLSYPRPLKEDVAKPLYDALTRVGLRTWFDDEELHWGDEFLIRIQEGLLQSRFAVVVIGISSHGRYYQQQEIQSLHKLESSQKQMILPLLHNVSVKQFTNDYPFMSNKQALSTQLSYQELAEIALRIVEKERESLS